VAKINKDYKSWFFVGEVGLSEEAIIECNCGALIEKSDALKPCNLSSIKDCLSLNV
jgi:hypothetical protein